ncbi:hypothetical protein HPO96_29330 [Kribbella sandramycini]|uniref:DUF4913 domain-containing protein n=1 Tax=Kribbella sandramycini TaxID=60450 RepID=A0A7Y4P2S8_9ACTN|nr:hypothetical protein [Kribbella sandramycini]MBB6571714.1 hypothetical protein [Kribbella sandramycini]NOL44358.1 hypothetical protein [Kribbella sandramycini]
MKHTDHEDPETTALKAVAAVAREVEKLDRGLQALKGGMRTTASKQSVTDLAEIVTALSETVMSMTHKAGTEPVAVRSWLRLAEDDADAVKAVLSELVPWMQDTYLRYHDAAETLPPCWLWHPEIVEELVWLMDAWTAAFYGPEASIRLVGDWHDRQRPGVMRRVGLYSSNCDLTIHKERADAAPKAVPLVDHLDQFVTWWSTDRAGHGPAPTEDQIRAGRRNGLTAVPARDGSY